jgi:hypothetical protein
MDARTFLDGRNVVVFEHLAVGSDVADAITRHIANPLDPVLHASVAKELAELAAKKREKYAAPGLPAQIKLVYFFLTEGMQGMAGGRTLADQQEAEIKEAFRQFAWPPGFPDIVVIGISELRPILAMVEARLPSVKVAEFLLKSDGKGGYDTPKIAASLIQLARRDYIRQEIFLRVDDDVQPTAEGIGELKAAYWELIREGANRHFCMSWNYESDPAALSDSAAPSGPDYGRLFRHVVNSYSIRTTFMSSPSLRCRLEPTTGQLRAVPARNAALDKQPCRLNLIHIKYFLDLFREGRWGSCLDDPISGAGLCFSPDSLIELPPWTNADELITWIDDFIKYELMRVYYGKRFAADRRLLRSPTYPGFAQDRNDPEKLKPSDIEWSTNAYLDRVLMGCILSYCVDPTRYGGPAEGFAKLLQEHDYLTAQRLWKSSLERTLAAGSLEHVRKVLLDWQHFFCAKAGSSTPEYSHQAQVPCGFVPAPADSFFNAYTLKQLLAIEEGNFKLVTQVLHVLERYLEMKYLFWPHVVESIDSLRQMFAASRALGAADWLFVGLAALGPAEDRPVERESRACLALIRDPAAQDPARWLMQWNKNWKVMHLIGGHREDKDPNDLACMIRELHEELFDELQPDQLETMRDVLGNCDAYEGPVGGWSDPYLAAVRPSRDPPHAFPEFVAWSGGYGQWTRYHLRLYEVQLTERGRAALFPAAPFAPCQPDQKPEGSNEWVSRDDVGRGWTLLGRPISPTAHYVLGVS